MRDWSDKEVSILKSFYPKEGNKVSRRLPGKNRAHINKMVKELGLKWKESREYNQWTEEEEDILKTYYPIEGKEVSKRLPRHTVASIQSFAREHGLTFRSDYWTEEEDIIIKNDYSLNGQKVTEKLPGRT